MAWIESHQHLVNHPKTLKLSVMMCWDVYATIGRLHALWWWCLDYAADGHVSRHSADIVAQSIGLPPADGEKLMTALYECEFLDVTAKKQYLIHDWLEYAGRYLKDTKYRRNPEKIQEIKALYSTIVSRQSADNPPKKRRKSAVPDLTLPDLTNQPTVATGLAALLADCILINDEHNRELRNGHREQTINSWASDIDKMMRLDGENRTESEIRARIIWCQKDAFWHRNILSAGKFRDKFDRLGLDMKKPNRAMTVKHAGIDEWLEEHYARQRQTEVCGAHEGPGGNV